MNSPSASDLSKKTVLELEEMLQREKALLKKLPFLQKLPDKGAKLKEKVVKIEEEIAARRCPENSAEFLTKRSEVEKLEWKFRSLASSSSLKPKIQTISAMDCASSPVTTEVKLNEVLDSDDDDASSASDSDEKLKEMSIQSKKDEVNGDNEMVFKMLATSQISQNQPKLCAPERNKRTIECPLYVKRLSEVVDHRDKKIRFVLNRPKLTTPQIEAVDGGEGNPSPDPSFVSCLSPALSNSSSNSKDDFETCSSVSDNGSNVGKKVRHWDESLFRPSNVFGAVKPLSFDESFRLTQDQADKVKELELKQRAEIRKTHPFDALKNAAFGSAAFHVRFPKPQIKEENDEDQDYSDELSEESEPSDEDDDDSSGDSDGEAGNRSETLSKLINTSLKLS